MEILNEFYFYIKQGLAHISDFSGFDHMLFIVVLCANYSTKEWKKILVLVTAFTMGHSITLLCTSLGYLPVNYDLVETLIPITIMLTCIFNLVFQKQNNTKNKLVYVLALGFGLIHGMGFSNFFSSMFMGIDEGILLQLFAFNIGIEFGQIIIVIITLGIQFILLRYIPKITISIWMKMISVTGLTLSIYLLL